MSPLIFRILAALLSGLLVAMCFPGLSFPYLSMGWIMPVALVPLFLALEQIRMQSPTTTQRSRRGLGLSMRTASVGDRMHRVLLSSFVVWLFGVVLVSVAFFWCTYPAILFGNIPASATYPAFALYALLSGTFFVVLFSPAILAASTPARSGQDALPIVALAAVSVGLEVWTPRFFNWSLGSLMHNSLSLSQFASVLGFNGLTLLIMTSNLGLARSLAEHSSRPLRSFGRVLALGSMWLACWLWGHYRVQTLEADFAQGRSTRVGLVQPNFTFDELSSRPERSASAQEQSLDNLLAQTERLMNDDGGNLDLVIWPESVAPSHFAQSEDQIELTRDLAMRSGTPILVQATAFDDAEVASKGYRRATIHSTSFLIRPDGSRSPSYRKWVPIPFGETVPFEEHFPELGDWLRDNVGNTSKVGRGTSFAALPYSPHDYVAPLICFDAIEPELPRLQTRYGGATLLVNQSNFVWMGRSAAGYQFKELVRMRAIENGRSAVLAANTGPSVIFSPVGRELTKTTPLLEVATLKADVPVSTITTPFSVWGRYPLHFFAVLGLVAIVIRMSSFGRRQPSRFFPL